MSETKQKSGIFDTIIKLGSISATILGCLHLYQLTLDREERAWDPASSFKTRTEYLGKHNLKYCEESVYENKTGEYIWDKTYEPSWDEVHNNISIDPANNPVKNGCWKPLPDDCIQRQQTIIVTPYRKREKHLKLLLLKLHPFLQRQKLDYCILVAEQFDGGMFNTGMMKNAGFLEGVKLPHFTDRGLEANCFIINDVDLLPENDKNIYMCADSYAVHLSDRIDKMEYALHSGGMLGGVAMLPRETYEYANGHSNLYWGWGGEDGDIGWRVHYAMGGNYLLYPKDGYGTYKMMEHLHPWTNFPKPPAGDNILDMVNDYVAASTGVLRMHDHLEKNTRMSLVIFEEITKGCRRNIFISQKIIAQARNCSFRRLQLINETFRI